MFNAVDSLVGIPQIQFQGIVVDTTPRMQPGQLLTASDNYWGTGEFIYGRASAAIRAFGLCVATPVFDATLGAYRWDFSEVPNATNLGRMLAVAPLALTAGQYTWFQVTGITPVNCTAAVLAGTTFGIAAAGQGGANSASKQVLNAVVVAPATTTVVKANCVAASGSTLLQAPNTDGWFVGAYLSGTGIAAGTTIVSIDATQRFVTLSAGTTATVAGSVTATYNNGAVFYNVAHLNRPFAQGAIT
jgi:hypothetical protein